MFCTVTFAFFMLMPWSPALALTSGDPPPKIPKIENPLGDRNDLGALIVYVVIEVTKVGFYVVVVFVIYSGFLFVKAAGNVEKLKTAKVVFLYTVIGGGILLGATVLATVIKGTVDAISTRDYPEEVTIV